MPVTPLKKQFGAQLRTFLLASGRKSCDLAAALQVSNSAVSQMLTGKIIPRLNQLKIISRILALSGDQETGLAGMLMNIRNGETAFLSRFNQFFGAACRKRGVSLQQLSGMTGVPLSRLKLFENCYDVMPLFNEIKRLAPVLECSQEDMLLAAGLGIVPAPPAKQFFAAEPGCTAAVRGPRLLPMVDIACFRKYSREMPLYSFAVEHATRQTERGAALPVPAVAVQASARQLKLGIAGEVLLLLSEQLPKGYRRLELFSDKKQNLRIRERKAGTWKFFELPENPDAETTGYAVWSLNILELVIRPVNTGVMEE